MSDSGKTETATKTPPEPLHPGDPLINEPMLSPETRDLAQFSDLELAQALLQRMAIAPNDWHRLKANRKARALEQASTALVYLLKDQPEEALARLQQAAGWLDRSVSAPPCPTHGR